MNRMAREREIEHKRRIYMAIKTEFAVEKVRKQNNKERNLFKKPSIIGSFVIILMVGM